jgi:transglutaminase-like putative cysteine protease
MKIKALTILLFLSGYFLLNAQNYKLGKVSKEELSETENSLYPESEATVLYREYRSAYAYNQSKGFVLTTKVFERIKIYNAEGYNWGTRKIKAYNYGKNREQVNGISATTYNLENGSIKKEKLNRKSIFEERLNDYYVSTAFTLPNLKPRCVIEIEYTIESDQSALEDVDLQYKIPIKKLMVDVKVPDRFVYKNYPNPQANLSYFYEETEKNIEVELRGRSGVGTADYGNFRDSGKDQNQVVTYKERRFILEEVNIPPLKDEGYVDNLRNYQARTIWELVMVKNPGGLPKSYATSWEAVTQNIYENDNFVNEILKKEYYASDVAAAMSQADTPEKKMAAIFNLVKQKVAWNGYYGKYPINGVKKAYKEGKGNSADINLMLVSMLQSANLDASPILVSTRNNGIPVYPTRYGFNYVVAHVSLSGNSYIMDATDPYSSIGMLPQRAMNWQGRLIRPDGSSSWVPLYPTTISNKLTYVQAALEPSGAFIKVRERLSSQYAKEYRTNNHHKPVVSQLEDMYKNGEDVVFSHLEVKDLNNTKPNLTLSYEANSPSVVEEISGDLYVSPMLYFAKKENPFKEESRSYPLFFDFPKSHKYSISLKIPEGYAIKSMPESIKAALAGEVVTYSYLISEQGGSVQLSVELAINKPALVPEDYEYIKGIFSQIVEKENEKIVLSKI